MRKHLIWLLLCPIALFATEYAPWYERNLELRPKATLLYQTYNSVQSPHRPKRHPSNDIFLDLSLSTYLMAFGVELETSFAHTRHQRQLNWDDLSLTGRYQLLDDVTGDPISLTAGATIRQVLKLARHDVSCFYHGGLEGEFHLAAGVETSCAQFWVSRLWGMLGLGIADLGSPWIRANLEWNHNCYDLYGASLYLNTLWGLGRNNLRLKDFKGYGPIAHRSADAGIRYGHTFEFGGTLGVGIARRIYARNCPRNVNQVYICFIYPFGL